MTVFTQIHQSHYNTAYNIFFDNKFFGIGNKMFRIVCKDQKYKQINMDVQLILIIIIFKSYGKWSNWL